MEQASATRVRARAHTHTIHTQYTHIHTHTHAGARLASEILSSNISLKHLKLSNNEITAEGCACIADGLRNNKVLESLDLSGNLFGDQGVSSIVDARIANKESLLGDIEVRYCGLTEEGGVELLRMVVSLQALQTSLLESDRPAAAKIIIRVFVEEGCISHEMQRDIKRIVGEISATAKSIDKQTSVGKFAYVYSSSVALEFSADQLELLDNIQKAYAHALKKGIFQPKHKC